MRVARHWESTGRKLGCFPSPPAFPSCPNPRATGRFAQRSVLLRQSQGRNQTPSPIAPAPATRRSHPGAAETVQPDSHGALDAMNPPASVLPGSPTPSAVPTAQVAIQGLILPSRTCMWPWPWQLADSLPVLREGLWKRLPFPSEPDSCGTFPARLHRWRRDEPAPQRRCGPCRLGRGGRRWGAYHGTERLQIVSRMVAR